MTDTVGQNTEFAKGKGEDAVELSEIDLEILGS
jgi:hypothetical protein